jgi:hypothetical protein
MQLVIYVLIVIVDTLTDYSSLVKWENQACMLLPILCSLCTSGERPEAQTATLNLYYIGNAVN